MARSSMEQRKARALEALLTSATYTEAAEKAGISRKTLYNYIRQDTEFGEAYKETRDQAIIALMDMLNAGKERATRLLLEIMDDADQPAGLRMRAAQAILSAAEKQQELAQRIQVASPMFSLYDN